MYKAFIVFSGEGDEFMKHGVYSSRQKADAAAHSTDNQYGYRVWECVCPTKRDLEAQVEDDLTDEQAREFAIMGLAKHPDGLYLLSRIRKLIASHFDDNDFLSGFRLARRYNCVRLYLFPGESEMSHGQILDEYLERRAFESSL